MSTEHSTGRLASSLDTDCTNLTASIMIIPPSDELSVDPMVNYVYPGPFIAFANTHTPPLVL